jgi:protein-S-isoprenylcysteine O-methyltransferase Ste14
MNRYPLAVTFVLLVLSFGLGWLYPIPTGLGFYGRLLGWLLLVGGASLLGVAAGLFWQRGTTVNPTKKPDQLVTDGLYRITRNPMYLGMLLILLGAPLAQDALLGFLFAIIFFLVMDKMIIPREEQVIEKSFGEPYRMYKKRTRRWL